ncbi:MAG TPA: sugar ABC transporter substrate-binding protein [Micromonosporaceae bacterium]
MAATLVVSALTACGSSGKSSDATSGVTLTYWASNQGTSLANDKAVLQPELDKFKAQTGITVNVEVVGWADLLNRILAATTSGQGPDVFNIGNTWSPSLQATGALLPFDGTNMAAIGGKDRFLSGSLSATGAVGKAPTAVPIYSLAYALYYNKKEFAAAGITSPPATWDDLVADGKRLTTGKQWGLALEAGSPTESIHNVFVLSQQYGGGFFDSSGKPTFNTPQNVAAIQRYLNFMGTDKIVDPSDAQYSTNQSITDFASGKAAMIMWQAADSSIKQHGMSADDYGVVPVPFETPAPSGSQHIDSMVAGINLAVMANTKHKAAALQFVKFMTSDSEQITLNKAYSSLPTVTGAYSDPTFQTPTVKTFQKILSTTAAALPEVPAESQFETLIGAMMKGLFADIASGKTVSDSEIASQLATAQQQVTS